MWIVGIVMIHVEAKMAKGANLPLILLIPKGANLPLFFPPQKNANKKEEQICLQARKNNSFCAGRCYYSALFDLKLLLYWVSGKLRIEVGGMIHI
jgi:hypothetical protein